MKNSLLVLGIMSGSSLDGIDMAWIRFDQTEGSSFAARFQWIKTVCHPYHEDWIDRLRQADEMSASQLLALHAEYAEYQAQVIELFRDDNIPVDLIAWHGHTIYHRPDKGFSFQLGRGDILAERTQTKVVSDFRNQNIALQGQGAPLAPIVDVYYFKEYGHLINLGGICNITQNKERPLAFDICGFNQVLNALAMELGKPMDIDGNVSGAGKLNQDLRKELNDWIYLSRPAPKSLSNQEVMRFYIPLLKKWDLPVEDKMKTFLYHVCDNIQTNLSGLRADSKILLSGGGANNKTFVSMLKERLKCTVHIAPDPWQDYKEAFLMAFMGYLKWNNLPNILSSVSGSTRDHSAGIIFNP